MIVASAAPVTLDDAEVGAETARATVDEEDAEDDDDDDDPALLLLRPLRGEATAEAGLAQAVRRGCEEDDATEQRGATERAATVLAAIIVLLSFSL